MQTPGLNPNLEAYYAVVEEVITSLGISPDQARTKDGQGRVINGQWDLKKGSASVFVDVFTSPEGRAYVCVSSPVLQIVTSKRQALFEKLLLLNHEMYAVSFSINKDWIWLRGLRECDGMDANECRAIFDRVGWYGDHYDDQLKTEFGA